MSASDSARSVSVPIDRCDRDTLERAAAALRSGRALSLRTRDDAVADAAERIVRAFDLAVSRPDAEAAPALSAPSPSRPHDDRAVSLLARLRRAFVST
jgi:hypothetical protein